MGEIEHAGTAKAMPAIKTERMPAITSDPIPVLASERLPQIKTSEDAPEAVGEILETEQMPPVSAEDKIAFERGMPPIPKP